MICYNYVHCFLLFFVGFRWFGTLDEKPQKAFLRIGLVSVQINGVLESMWEGI